MDKIDALKSAIEALETEEEFSGAVRLIFRCGLIADEDILDEVNTRNIEPECEEDHIDDLTDDRLEAMGYIDRDSADVQRLAEFIAEGRTRDALDELQAIFGADITPHPSTLIKLAERRAGRDG